ncbi:MAG: phosphodiester glycosidase family protein [Verrucomicrobiota bacterium]
MPPAKSIRGLVASVLAFALSAPLAAGGAEWELVETKSRDVARAMKFVNLTARTDSKRASLSFILFPASVAGFRVIDQVDHRKPAYLDLADAMRKNDCIAGTNGGFFQKDFAPLGLQIAGGQRKGSFNDGSPLLSGVFFVDASGSPQLVRRSAFKDEPDVAHLLQSGPFLVDGSKAVSGLDAGRAATRTFLFRTSSNLWALGRCSRITLHDLGALLAEEKIMGAAKVQSALNLDGGTSSALWVKGGAENGRDHYDRSWANVRNFVGVVQKSPAP